MKDLSVGVFHVETTTEYATCECSKRPRYFVLNAICKLM